MEKITKEETIRLLTTIKGQARTDWRLAEALDLAIKALKNLPSAEPVKAYTKADYIMALHKEYGCTLIMAEEAHNKALEHLRSKARMKG